MKRVNQYHFYNLGTILHPLLLIPENANVFNHVWDLNRARSWLQWLLSNTLVTLVVSRAAADSLIETINKIIPDNYADFSSIDKNKTFDWAEWYNINNGIKEFETVFAAELPTFDVYLVSQKGIYSTADLIERAEMAIDSSARTNLPKEAIVDFNQAGRCLAFGLSTAAGFHTMRAVEAVLRSYWVLVIKPKSGTRRPLMAKCIQELRDHGEDEKIMDILDHIRDLHRNTIMHPETFLKMNEALRQFDISKSAVFAMGERINVLKSGP